MAVKFRQTRSDFAIDGPGAMVASAAWPDCGFALDWGRMAKILIIAGSLLLIIGLVLAWAPWLLSWFGRLPGDIRIERDNGVFFFPVTSMLLVSVVLSLLLALLFRR
jgi:hypothetical protein